MRFLAETYSLRQITLPVPHAQRPLPVWRQQQTDCHRLRWKVRAQAAQTSADPSLGLVNQPWTGAPQEVAALQELHKRLEGSPIAPQDEGLLQWYLRDRAFDVEAAEKKLTSMLAWRQDLRVDELRFEDVAGEFETGKGLVCEHPDVRGRPVLLIRAHLHRIGEWPIESTMQLTVYLLEQALSRLEDGGSETVLGIFDLRQFTTANADLTYARRLVDIFFTYYPKRLGQVLFVQAPWIFRPTWALVKPLLRKYAQLVRFVSVEQLQKEYFTPATLPEDFS